MGPVCICGGPIANGCGIGFMGGCDTCCNFNLAQISNWIPTQCAQTYAGKFSLLVIPAIVRYKPPSPTARHALNFPSSKRTIFTQFCATTWLRCSTKGTTSILFFQAIATKYCLV